MNNRNLDMLLPLLNCNLPWKQYEEDGNFIKAINKPPIFFTRQSTLLTDSASPEGFQSAGQYTDTPDKCKTLGVGKHLNYTTMDQIYHPIGTGYLELERGQSWHDWGVSVGDQISFFSNGQKYKILKLDSAVAKIAPVNSVFSDTKQTSKIVVPIPAHGREKLLRETIKLLKKQTHQVHIIVLGDTDSVKNIAEEENVMFVHHPNQPLGSKWQKGVECARELGADAILMLGSSDWISDKWCETMIKEIERGADLVGKRNMLFMDVDHKNEYSLISWNGYPPWVHYRTMEPIGAGRMISKNILDKIHWHLFDKDAIKSMDFISLRNVLFGGGEVNMIQDPCNNIMAMSVSFYHLWGNMHGYDRTCASPTSKRIMNITETLEQYFPEYDNACRRVNDKSVG
jgi:hypothetical protein